MTNEDVPAFLTAFREIAVMAHRVMGDGERFADVVGEHLGGPAGAFAVVTEGVMNHGYADWDTALALLASRDPGARELASAVETCATTLLTTNRAESLERALVRRPGRLDPR